MTEETIKSIVIPPIEKSSDGFAFFTTDNIVVQEEGDVYYKESTQIRRDLLPTAVLQNCSKVSAWCEQVSGPTHLVYLARKANLFASVLNPMLPYKVLTSSVAVGYTFINSLPGFRDRVLDLHPEMAVYKDIYPYLLANVDFVAQIRELVNYFKAIYLNNRGVVNLAIVDDQICLGITHDIVYSAVAIAKSELRQKRYLAKGEIDFFEVGIPNWSDVVTLNIARHLSKQLNLDQEDLQLRQIAKLVVGGGFAVINEYGNALLTPQQSKTYIVKVNGNKVEVNINDLVQGFLNELHDLLARI